jgi:isopentenyl-diphosphate delta-isomerase
MGPESLNSLMALPLEAIEFAALGGTNFSLLELKRGKGDKSPFNQLSEIGHTAEEMIFFINQMLTNKKNKFKCKKFIISGGVKDFLDGYYLMNKLNASAIYGQASAFLLHAKKNYTSLHKYIQSQIDGLMLAQNYLIPK